MNVWVNIVLGLSLIVLLGTAVAAVPQFERHGLDQRLWQILLFFGAAAGWIIALPSVCATVWRGQGRWYLAVAYILVGCAALHGLLLGTGNHAPRIWQIAALFCLWGLPVLMWVYLLLILNPDWRPGAIPARGLHYIALCVFLVPMFCGVNSIRVAARSVARERETFRRQRSRPVPHALTSESPLALWLEKLWSADNIENEGAMLKEIHRRPNLLQELSPLLVQSDQTGRELALRLLGTFQPFPGSLEPQVRNAVQILIEELDTAYPEDLDIHEGLILRTTAAADLSGAGYRDQAAVLLQRLQRFNPSSRRFVLEASLKQLRDR